jgi:predicted nucleotidyltransferase component of viral defense system
LIDRREILELATQTSLNPHVIEKDYVLGWVLAGIYAHEELAESWIFKGGTCLKKCFFETYRFSEDLDFTLRNEVQIDQVFLKRVFDKSAPGFTSRAASRSRQNFRSSRFTPIPAAESRARESSATRDRFHRRDRSPGSSST